MKRLFIILCSSVLLFSCGEDNKAHADTTSKEEHKKENTKPVDPAQEKKDFAELQEIEDHLMNTDLTIDIATAKKLHQKAIEFSEKYPNSEHLEMALDYAAKGAENGGLYKEAVEIYHKLANELPESNKTPIYMYEKGKVLEDKLMDKEAAKAAYKDLIKRFPRNPLSKDMKSYLKNGVIDMTKEEKINYYQEKNQG